MTILFRAAALRAAACAALLVAASLALAADAPDPLLGKEAPNLMGRSAFSPGLLKLDKLRRDVTVVMDASGRPVREGGKIKTEVTDFVVVINFFATYCVPCIQEIPAFNKIAASYEGKPVRFIYVNVDAERPQQEVVAFAKQKGITVDMMLPSVKNAIEAYQIKSLPRIVIVDRKGTVANVIGGFQDDLHKQIDAIVQPLIAAQS